MKSNERRLLTPAELERIAQTVSAAEKRTSGEIVCLIVPQSYHYPMAAVIGATALALPAAILLTPLFGGWLWIGTQNMWLFLGLLGLLWPPAYLLVKHTAFLKRIFISRKEMAEEVEEAAVVNFYQYGLYRTSAANGILIFISELEHTVWILADQGINAKVPGGQWNTIVERLTDGIRKGRPADAICDAVAAAGDILSTHFPLGPDDRDELRNVIIGE